MASIPNSAAAVEVNPERAVRLVFMEQWALSLTITDIRESCPQFTTEQVQTVCTRLARAELLRSRMNMGQRFYELRDAPLAAMMELAAQQRATMGL